MGLRGFSFCLNAWMPTGFQVLWFESVCWVLVLTGFVLVECVSVQQSSKP